MRRLQVKVVARTVEIYRQQVDCIEIILLAISLSLYQQHLLCQAIGCIGFLRVTVPKVFFAERDRGEFRVGADGSQRDKLLHTSQPGVLHQQRTHNEIRVGEAPGIGTIGPDAADFSREVHNDLRARVTIEPLHDFFPCQVILFNLRDKDLVDATVPQGAHHVLPEKAASSGYYEPFAADFHGTPRFMSALAASDLLSGNISYEVI